MSSDTSSTQSATRNIKAESAETAQTLKDEASKLVSTTQDAAESLTKNKAEDARAEVTARTDTVEAAVNDVAATLGEHSDTLGQYANEFAEKMSSLNDQIKNRSLDELASDARTLARDNPAMFMLGAVTIGAVAARFFQAGSTDSSPSQFARTKQYGSTQESNTVGHVPGSINTTNGGYTS